MDTARPLMVEPFDLAVHAAGKQCDGEMVIELELEFKGRLDEHLLARAADLLLDAEPVLGCRLVINAPKPHWEAVPAAERRELCVTYVPEGYESFRRTGLDATANVQVALCLWRRDAGDRLVVKMTHEVGDGVGLQSLAARLAAIYSELCVDPGYRPRTSLGARRDFGQILSEVPKGAYPALIRDFARVLVSHWFPRRTHGLALPRESAGPWVPVIKRVPSTQLSFLSRYGKARGATLNDVLLAAAYRALASRGVWDGTSGLRIAITVDLRRWCLRHPDASAICNLSSFEFPFLVRNLGRDFDETLANVTALTRRCKRHWPGLAPALAGHFLMKTWRHENLARAGVKDRPRKRARSGHTLTLSNEGALDKACLRFGAQTPVSAHILPPFLTLPNVHICVSGYDGALTLAAVTPQNGHVVVGSFLDALLEQLPGGEASTGGLQPANPGPAESGSAAPDFADATAASAITSARRPSSSVIDGARRSSIARTKSSSSRT